MFDDHKLCVWAKLFSSLLRRPGPFGDHKKVMGGESKGHKKKGKKREEVGKKEKEQKRKKVKGERNEQKARWR